MKKTANFYSSADKTAFWKPPNKKLNSVAKI